MAKGKTRFADVRLLKNMLEPKDNIQGIVIDYANGLGIYGVKIISIELKYYGFWMFRRVRSANVILNTDEGRIEVSMWPNAFTLHSFILKPNHEDGDRLPLWVAFPSFSSVTSGWRQGTGEPYRYTWLHWWKRLSESRKQRYRTRFPEPRDEARHELSGGWEGFYDRIAEIMSEPE